MAVPLSSCPFSKQNANDTDNDKGDNELITGAVHRSPDIYLTAEEALGKHELGDRLVKDVQPVIASNGVPYIQMRSVRSHRKSGREKEGKKERTRYLIYYVTYLQLYVMYAIFLIRNLYVLSAFLCMFGCFIQLAELY